MHVITQEARKLLGSERFPGPPLPTEFPLLSYVPNYVLTTVVPCLTITVTCEAPA
jgi:hypothetical protein